MLCTESLTCTRDILPHRSELASFLLLPLFSSFGSLKMSFAAQYHDSSEYRIGQYSLFGKFRHNSGISSFVAIYIFLRRIDVRSVMQRDLVCVCLLDVVNHSVLLAPHAQPSERTKLNNLNQSKQECH